MVGLKKDSTLGEKLPEETPKFRVRDLEIEDYNKGIMELLAQLSIVGTVSEADFRDAFEERRQITNQYKTIVIEDVTTGRLVATATVFSERKFLRGCGKAAHIEDVVVDSKYRGHGLGRRVVSAAADAARAGGCYKVILDCSPDNAPFYEACGFAKKEVQMVQYFT